MIGTKKKRGAGKDANQMVADTTSKFTSKVAETNSGLAPKKGRANGKYTFGKAAVDAALFVVTLIAMFTALIFAVSFGSGVINVVLAAATMSDVLTRVIVSSGILGGICGGIVMLTPKAFMAVRKRLMLWSGLETKEPVDIQEGN